MPLASPRPFINLRGALLLCLSACVVIVLVLLLFETQILAALSPYLPLDDGKTSAYYNDLYFVFVTEVGWTGFSMLLALVLSLLEDRHHVFTRIDQWMTKRHTRFMLGTIVTFAVVASVIALFVLEEFPNSSDEYVYLYQAQTLSDGHLYHSAAPVEDAFRFNHIAEKDGIRVGRFPPGWPLVMAIFIFVGIPAALANVILAVISLFVFYKLALKLFGIQVANWGLLLLTFSGFFLFNAASFFSHTSCLLEALLFIYGIHLFLERKQGVFALVAGAAFGLMLITRYYTALLIGAPYCLFILYRYRFQAVSLFLWMALGAIPLFAYFLWYNYSITGNPLSPVTVWAYDGEGLGFVKGHTLAKALEHVVRRVLMFIYWVSPIALVAYLVLITRKILNPKDRFLAVEDYFFVLLMAGYFFYYEIGGNQYGPRFYFEALPFLFLFILNRLFSERLDWARPLLLCVIVVLIIRLPLIAHREHKIVRERNDLYDKVMEAGLENVIILVGDGTGVLRPMPAGDLTRNDKGFQASVLYALDAPAVITSLRTRFPDRKFYRYTRKPESVSGQLDPVNIR